MVRYGKSNRRTKKRSGSIGAPPAGAGLFRFFEDSGMGMNVSPITATVFAVLLIVVVVLGHLGILNFMFTPS